MGIVALPLSMALAIATGVPPQHGLYTAIIAGTVTAALGGSKVQISGPTAAFVVILAPIAAQYGMAGLAVATVLAGLMLIGLGMLRLGRLIEFVPYPVTTGFTAGIAVVIATLQVKDFLGLPIGPGHAIEHLHDHYVPRVEDLAAAFNEKYLSGPVSFATFADVTIGVLTLLLLLLVARLTKRVPPALVALPVAALVAFVGHRVNPEFNPATIMSDFGSPAAPSGIPQQFPSFGLPWHLPGPVTSTGTPLPTTLAGVLSDVNLMRSLTVSAFAMAMLGAIVSLLSAVVADGMTGKKHDPDAELIAQGIGNVVGPFFGGFASTGAIARTATNIRTGARSPLAAVAHAGFLLVSLLALAPVLGYLPMAAMAALLIVVAKNMAEVRHFVFVLRFGPRGDIAVLLTCFFLTVLVDMTVAVGAGVMLASMLFMRRMAEVSTVKLVGEEHPALARPLPPGVVLYDVGGPLFFGAAQKAMSTLAEVGMPRAAGSHSGGQDAGHTKVRCVVLDFTDVPTMDATGLVNLDSAVTRLAQRGVYVVLAGVQSGPMELFERAGWTRDPKHMSRVAICGTVEAGVEVGRAWVEA